MAMTELTSCRVCGKEYRLCNCGGRGEIEKVACCFDHYKVYLPIIRYARQEISKRQAKKMLKEAVDNCTPFEVSDSIKRLYDEIMR